MIAFRTFMLRIWFLGLVILLSACQALLVSPTPTASAVPPVPQSTPLQPSAPTTEPTVAVFLPEVEKPLPETEVPVIVTTQADSADTQPVITGIQGSLGFLSQNDLWIADFPGGAPRRITSSADILTFNWSPDGSRLATYNGRSLCILDPSGAQVGECLDLALNEEQGRIPRGIVWSPDLNTIVLWNLVNPWDEEALGWLVVPLNAPQETIRITDPVDWGLSVSPNNEPGGMTGQPLFLADGTLLGTLSHRWLCGSGGCHYQLYRFDFSLRSFVPYPNNPEEGWSEGQNFQLSRDQNKIVNYGSFFSGCDSFVTFVDLFDLGSRARKTFNLEMEVVTSLDLSPEARRAAISRVTGCGSPPEQVTWDRSCGLSQGFDILPLQVWDLESDARTDLVPGTSPDWSPIGDWVAFRSCLAANPAGSYDISAAGPPAIFILDLGTGSILPVGEGQYPTWKPN